jgi:hypothetical protein
VGELGSACIIGEESYAEKYIYYANILKPSPLVFKTFYYLHSSAEARKYAVTEEKSRNVNFAGEKLLIDIRYQNMI